MGWRTVLGRLSQRKSPQLRGAVVQMVGAQVEACMMFSRNSTQRPWWPQRSVITLIIYVLISPWCKIIIIWGLIHCDNQGDLQTLKWQAYSLNSTLFYWNLMQFNLHLNLEPWPSCLNYSLWCPMSNFRIWLISYRKNRLMFHNCFIIAVFVDGCMRVTSNIEISE